jgi:hypothetical protein
MQHREWNDHEYKMLVTKVISYWQGRKKIESLTEEDIKEAIKYKK